MSSSPIGKSASASPEVPVAAMGGAGARTRDVDAAGRALGRGGGKLVTVAMRELATGNLQMGPGLIDDAKLDQHLSRTRAAQQEALQAQQAGAYQMPDFDND